MLARVLTPMLLLLPTAPLRADGPTPAPPFPDKPVWVQGDPQTWDRLAGRVVAVHFWAHGCINCQRNYPVYRGWAERYAKRDLTLIGVHTPEFDGEKDADGVRRQARTNGLTFPILADNDSAAWRAWNVRYWPTIFLVDRKGVVRYHWEGELHLDTEAGKRFAARIDELLAEPR